MSVCPTPQKIAYDHRGNARHLAKRTNGCALHVYRCQCGYWHLSSQSRRQVRLRQKNRHPLKEVA